MELPVLDKFCFIFHLRTGCITMGIMNSIITFVLAVILITFAVDIKAADSKSEDAVSSVVYTIVVLMVVLLLVKFILDMVFVYAVYKEKSSLMKKYCIFWVVFLVLFIIGFLKSLFHMGAGHVIAQILFLAENFYYIVVIRSYLISIHEDGMLRGCSGPDKRASTLCNAASTQDTCMSFNCLTCTPHAPPAARPI